MYNLLTALVAAGIVTVLVVVWGFSGDAVIRKTGPTIALGTPALREIETFLDEYKRDWTPRARERLLDRMRAQAATLELQVQSLLKIPDHPLLKECIEVAAELDLQQARPLVAMIALTGDTALRPRAITAANRIAPWSRDKLEVLLKTEDLPALCAALEVAVDCKDAPYEQIVSYLGHPEAAVRAAAVRAFPAESHPEALRAVLEFLIQSPDHGTVSAIRVLGRMPLTRESEIVLGEHLVSPERGWRLAALESLTREGQRLHHPDPIWHRAVALDANQLEQALACYCLERTRSFDPESVADALANLTPKAQYFAARCLISAGDRRGVAALLTLIEEGAPPDVAYSAQHLLAFLSRTWINEDPSVWRHWFESTYEPRPRQLPAVPLGN